MTLLDEAPEGAFEKMKRLLEESPEDLFLKKVEAFLVKPCFVDCQEIDEKERVALEALAKWETKRTGH